MGNVVVVVVGGSVVVVVVVEVGNRVEEGNRVEVVVVENNVEVVEVGGGMAPPTSTPRDWPPGTVQVATQLAWPPESVTAGSGGGMIQDPPPTSWTARPGSGWAVTVPSLCTWRVFTCTTTCDGSVAIGGSGATADCTSGVERSSSWRVTTLSAPSARKNVFGET